MMGRALACGVLALLLTGCGITGNFRNDPGYASFGSPGPLDTDREIGLSLGPLPLKLARWMLDDDPELKPMLKELRAVRVYIYQVTGRTERVARRVQDVEAELVGDGWIPIVAIDDDEELVSVLLRVGRRGSNEGLAVIIQDPSEVVLVNLIGNVRLEFVNGYMAELDVDVPPIEIDPATLQAYAR